MLGRWRNRLSTTLPRGLMARGDQVAPGGVLVGTKAKDRLILPGRYMAARNTTVHDYLARRRAAATAS